ncbi:sigma-70 family RNA polymerase sigma factor [Salisediminibacterium beveridgei]|uniref:RNA polymerase sigma factor SigZ n=1 Tax=Salisediminibacterium beveridgei TaxID=632773 RepID=A0A1D7QZL6_9BACI|nr:sigma-70 family RNA polymerase sigma factor [Salisediminibacterium beveridgei]AOM84400.1 RNA polymerase sigma factor SigZ [Salisediminibacterium beveridgei]
MAAELDRMVETFEQELRGFVFKKVANPHDAEDVLQHVWLKALQQQDKIADVAHVRGWLYQIARHTVTDYYRKKRMEVPREHVQDEPGPVTFEEADNENLGCASYIQRELQKLPEKYQLPFSLYVEKGWKHKQISTHLDLSLSGSKTRVQRAKRQLKDILLNCCDVEVDAYGNVIRYEKKRVCCA